LQIGGTLLLVTWTHVITILVSVITMVRKYWFHVFSTKTCDTIWSCHDFIYFL